ncbi:RNA-binding S4 domain-containing protein [Flexibacterium corallicola]|uniref:RNA-binding S4 domain-containing protein n=1 Tax=Flexibacterium corallicola TaxID=3037259 RepID=UPI00286F9248|nr:RNA-binding S4 domain-containing protein [Pseudovibrio sp. M1P-2-3]
MDTQASQRIDKWLWYARVTKSRTLAQKLSVSGHVRVNKVKISAAKHPIKKGDVLTIALPRRTMILKVLELGTRRGPAPEAQLLYEDLSPPPPPKPKVAHGERERGSGRPTKRERRKMIHFMNVKENDSD